MVTVVPINTIKSLTGDNIPNWHIRKMASVLEKQGQIEPLQVYPVKIKDSAIKYAVFIQDAHGHEIVCAAKMLGWDTLLIVEMARYEN